MEKYELSLVLVLALAVLVGNGNAYHSCAQNVEGKHSKPPELFSHSVYGPHRNILWLVRMENTTKVLFTAGCIDS